MSAVEVALERVVDEIAIIVVVGVAVVRKPTVAIESLLKSFGIHSWERSSWMPSQYSNVNFQCV
jgi:hypothetical protein